MIRKTKIIASVGPASWHEDVLSRLIREGADAFRINFAHAKHEEALKVIKIIRSLEERYDCRVAVIGDLRGPTIRTGEVEPYPISRGDIVKIVPKEKGSAKEKELPLPDKRVYATLEEGDIILLEGGRIKLIVEEVKTDHIIARALTDGVIKSRRTFALQNKELDLPAITDKDVKDVKFCVENDFDYISLSFVRSRFDVESLRKLIDDFGGGDIGVIAKIETRSAVNNLRNILSVSDAVMIARGDLGMFFDLTEIPRLQYSIIVEARKVGVPTIIATQLLESMVENPMPTRAEVVDVMTAVKQGVDALLLANETASGKYPVEAVRWLRKIIVTAEKELAFEVPESEHDTLYEKFAKGVALMAETLNAKIIALTRRGNTARRIARYRPHVPIYAVTQSVKVARKLKLIWGIHPFLSPTISIHNVDPIVSMLKEKGALTYGDIAIVTAGLVEGATDIVKIVSVK